MYYTVRKGKSTKNYTVIKAPIRNMGNNWIFGVKFCQSYGVVEKNSKAYYQVTRSPIFKGFKEVPLSFLKKIFRSRDIELIFGRDIFLHYVDALKASNLETEIMEDSKENLGQLKTETLEETNLSKCDFIKSDGTICGNDSSPASPLGYCFGHLRYDETRKSNKTEIRGE